MGQNALPRSFFKSLHDKCAELKGSKLMVHRKGNLHVKGSRSSEKDQEDLDIMIAASRVRAPRPLQTGGIYSAEGNGESVPVLVLLS